MSTEPSDLLPIVTSKYRTAEDQQKIAENEKKILDAIAAEEWSEPVSGDELNFILNTWLNTNDI